MSDTRTSDLFDAAAPAEGTDRRPGWWRRNRGVVVIALLLLGALVLTVLTSPGGAGERLDADNAAPVGGRALAEVLRDQGVDVRPESTLATVLDAAGPGTTVLVLESDLLDPERLRRLRATGADLVLVAPGLPVLQVLAPELTVAGTSEAQGADPDCEDPDAVAAGEVRGGGRAYTAGVADEPPSAAARVSVCYPLPDSPGTGSYAVVDDPEEGRRVVVHGQDDLLTNQFLAQEGNAALALRSLGANPTLLWYRVDPLDVADPSDAAPSATDLLPGWVRWVAVQLALVLLVVVLWRARRLGRLVPERLPAVVRSAETAEGRARLYRSAAARPTSAALLRAAGTRRLAGRLGARAGSSTTDVARLAAGATGRDPNDVLAVLAGPAPHDDAGLVRLADQIDDLEREVTDR